jgi:hypothetical protein
VQSAETITSHQAMQSGATMHCTGVSSSCMRAWKSFSGFGFVKAITCSLARTCVSSSCMRAWKSFSGSGFVDHHCDSTSDVVMGTFSASRGNQRPSRAITGDQWRSREIKGDRTFSSSANRDSSSDLLTCNQAYTRVIVGPSEAIRGHQRPSPRGSWRGNQRPSPRGSWRGHQRPSEAITSRLLARQSEAIRGHHLAALGEAIRGHQRPSPRGSWRGNQRPSEAITSRLLARQSEAIRGHHLAALGEAACSYMLSERVANRRVQVRQLASLSRHGLELDRYGAVGREGLQCDHCGLHTAGEWRGPDRAHLWGGDRGRRRDEHLHAGLHTAGEWRGPDRAHLRPSGAISGHQD